jgi:hypothetical protein
VCIFAALFYLLCMPSLALKNILFTVQCMSGKRGMLEVMKLPQSCQGDMGCQADNDIASLSHGEFAIGEGLQQLFVILPRSV